MMEEKKPVIHFDHIDFAFEQKEDILKDITLDVYKGETIGIVGANGAGKSTLMKLIMGLLKPSRGKVTVLGMEVCSKNVKEIRKKAGYTFQDPDNQLFMPSVYEDVAFGARQEGKPEKEIKKIVEAALQEVNALSLIDKASYKMSGGEKRVVTLATVLASAPEILILDEPSVGLDPWSRRNLIRLLSKRKETKMIATHDMDLAMDLCDRIIVIYNGVIQAIDTPTNIFGNRDLLCSNHLELPLRLQGCPVCGHVGSHNMVSTGN